MRRAALCALVLLVACGQSSGMPAPSDPDAAYLGGDGTIFDDGDESFAYPAKNLSDANRGPFQIGDGIFNRNWIPAPATPVGTDGLGPTFNATSCSGCHIDNGRGEPPTNAGDPFLGLLLRVSVPGTGPHGGPVGDPTYGDQIQPNGIFGVPGEGTPGVTYVEAAGAYADGTTYSLRKPTYTFTPGTFGPLGDGAMMGPRLAPQTIGLGLLQAVDEATILGFAQANGGKANYVWSDRSQTTMLGRFGWKANQPTIEQQALAAARNDIGITNTLYTTNNCPAPQTKCASAPPSSSSPELQALYENGLIIHAMSVAVPARRNLDDPTALHGETLFGQAGCSECHITKMTTGTLANWPELSNQTIRPFTDLLLHDMGPDLADGRPDYLASGSEWRTPPLWGLGLVQPIEGALFLMHDGRARSFEEAILWHGGAGSQSHDAFVAMSKSDRDALVAFLSSL